MKKAKISWMSKNECDHLVKQDEKRKQQITTFSQESPNQELISKIDKLEKKLAALEKLI